MSGPEVPNVFEAINADLAAEQGRKRRHFGPAMVLAVLVVGSLFAMHGLRTDLAHLPAWRLGVLAVSWLLCLWLLPAIGVGLWFPSRTTRVVLVATAITLAPLGAFGWPMQPSTAGFQAPCGAMLLGVGLVFGVLGALSGAFAQRRAVRSTFWVAGGITLAALGSVTWICPNDAADHITSTHLMPALGLAVLVGLIGVVVHRRMRR